MAHVELSLLAVEAPPDTVPPLRVLNLQPRPLGGWLDAVDAAEEPCLVLDAGGVIAAASASCVQLLGALSPDGFIGRGLLEDVIDVVDFTAAGDRLADAHLERLPPLLALSSGALSRGLLRIRTGRGVCTLDAVSTPLRLDGELAGSLTFFHLV